MQTMIDSDRRDERCEVAVTLISASGRLRNVRKRFRTEAARERYLERVDENGTLYQVNAYADGWE